MESRTSERLFVTLLLTVAVLVLAACNATGGAEPAVGNVDNVEDSAAVDLAKASEPIPETDTSIGNGSGESMEATETRGETIASGENSANGEQSHEQEVVQEEPTAEPTKKIIPTATPLPPTSTPELLVEDGVFLADDRPEYLVQATKGWNTNWARHTVAYEDLLTGGPPRDGIPSIDDPSFVPIEEASVWLAGNEPVIVLEINRDARAYPLQILTWHEIVNDTVGEVPVIITFCPLCNSALVFDRGLDGDEYEFGTSGFLRHSDLVMYDRTTESLWQQFTGEGIVGDLAGKQLTFLPSSLVSFANFRDAFPEGVVLSQETGFSRPYGINPYAGYDTYDSPLSQGGNIALLNTEEDPRLPAAARVVTVSLPEDEIDIAYPLSILSEVTVINDQQGEQEIAVFFSPGTSSALGAELISIGEDVGATGVFDPKLDDQTLTFSQRDGEIIDNQTSSTWNILGQATSGAFSGKSLQPLVHGDHFWFSWAAFKPDTIIYQES